ncbi:TRAP transporter small permease [Marispirochaeta sp.]|jgi:TRAP-type transport system small permease protein|uniref:TRAP transporter small permease n=1 Tax=Marispirochaeta sp. TaxID=2038653 RepID=UPI0029C8C5F8|nr:TRAP transporter small permease [Marispirochaeta sp.]
MEKKLVRILEIICGAFLVAMVALLFAQVGTRYILQGSLLWAGEIAVWFFVWITYLGAVILYINKKHIVVDILTTFLPEKVNKTIEMISSVIILIFLLIVFKESIPVVISYSKQTATSVALSKKYLFSSLSVSTGLMILYTIYSFIHKLRRH